MRHITLLICLPCIVFLIGCQEPAPSSGTASADAGVSTARALDAHQADADLNENQRLNVWFDEKFEERLRMSPAWLARLGRKERYDEYDDLSEAEADRQLAWMEASVAEMEERFDYEALDAETRTSWDLWIYQYEQAKQAKVYRRGNYIFTQMMGPQSQVAQFLIRFHRVDEESDLVAYASRIGGISDAIQDLLERAKLNAEHGVRPPRFAYEGAIREAVNLTTGAPFSGIGPDSPLWVDAKKKASELVSTGEIDQKTADRLLGDVSDALTGQFEPAYGELVNWLNADMDNASPTAEGVHANPDGAAYYQYRLEASTTTDLTAEQIHEIGLTEVARLRAEMEAIRARVGFEGDLQAFFVHLKTDPQFLYPNDDEGRQAYIRDSERYLNFINARLPDYFGTLPEADLVVRRVEAFREQDGAPQHYLRGAPDGSRPGIYYAHLSDMSAMPKPLMEAVAYHEGNPGHHMQISIAQESTSVPRFRTQMGFTAFSEGWGLYAEYLAKEMGAYQDPYSEFGRLSTEMWRAIRLVVDTGIHAKGWTEDGAIAYFRDNSAVADGAIRAEVQRYFAWPGQATAYKIGMLKILELRARAEVALGSRFDIRAFHDRVLTGGAVPLKILERRIDTWIEELSRT
jgi:uncharacterized protein (DUF885 family)